MRAKTTTFGIVALCLTGISGLGAQVSQQGSARASVHQEFTFANIAWGSSAENVKAAMSAQGLTFYRTVGEDNLIFTGRLMDQKVAAYAMMARDSVTKIAIVFFQPERARRFYNSMMGTLIEKYGPPRDTTVSFSAPYHEGDGRVDEAIAADKASFMATWGEDEEKTQTMWLLLEHHDVVLAYETPAFVREANRKKARPF